MSATDTALNIAPMRWPCVCCGYFTLSQPTGESDDICQVCFWQDALVDNRNTELLGPNRVTLAVARQNYERFGAHEERWLANVRPPTPEEMPPHARRS